MKMDEFDTPMYNYVLLFALAVLGVACIYAVWDADQEMIKANQSGPGRWDSRSEIVLPQETNVTNYFEDCVIAEDGFEYCRMIE